MLTIFWNNLFFRQVYQSASGYVPATTSQYQAQSVATNTVSNSNAGYQAYQPQAYQSSVTTFTSPITQSSGAYQSAAQSVSTNYYRLLHFDYIVKTAIKNLHLIASL